MTISNSNSSVTVAATGASYVYDFSFVGVSASNIVVVYTNTVGTETTLTSSQYTLVLNLPATNQLWGVGGNIVFPLSGPALSIGESLTITRVLPFTQETTVRNQGNYYATVTEEALDLLEMQIQQLANEVSGGSPSEFTSILTPLISGGIAVDSTLTLEGKLGGGGVVLTAPVLSLPYTLATGTQIGVLTMSVGGVDPITDTLSAAATSQLIAVGGSYDDDHAPAGGAFQINQISSVGYQTGTTPLVGIWSKVDGDSGGSAVWAFAGGAVGRQTGDFATGAQFDVSVFDSGINSVCAILAVGGDNTNPATAYLQMVANAAGNAVAAAIILEDTLSSPIYSTGSIMQTGNGNNLSCAYGFKFDNATFSTAFLKSRGFSVDGTGAIIGKNVSANAAAAFFSATCSVTTNRVYMQLNNGSGNYLIGNESSVGGDLFPGSTALAGVIGTASSRPLQIFTNNTLRGQYTAAGLYQAGVVSVVSNNTATVTISNVAPAAVSTATIKEWMLVKNSSGVDRYIPMWGA